MIHLYIGNGKGKTTAAVGLAIRARGAGKRVCFVQFLKGGCISSEIMPLKKIGVNVVRFSQRHPIFCKNISVPNLKKRISQDLNKVEKILRKMKYSVVILDEMLSALNSKFIGEKDIL